MSLKALSRALRTGIWAFYVLLPLDMTLRVDNDDEVEPEDLSRTSP